MHEDKKTSNKRYCLWVLTFLLTVVGLCNLLLSITVITVLRISRGMEALEIIPDENLIKFYGRTDLDKVNVKCQSEMYEMIIVCCCLDENTIRYIPRIRESTYGNYQSLRRCARQSERS